MLTRYQACSCNGRHSDACKQRAYRERQRERTLKQTRRTHEHIVSDGSIQEVPVKFAESVGLLCPVCGFHISRRGIEYVVSIQKALGIV